MGEEKIQEEQQTETEETLETTKTTESEETQTTTEPQPEETEQKKQEEPQGNAVKVLRKKLEDVLKEKKVLEEKLQKIDQLESVANIDEIAKKIDKLEFKTTIYERFPKLANEVDEVWKSRKIGESFEDTIARYVGKKALSNSQEGFSLGTRSVNVSPETDISKLPPEQREQKAREMFKQAYGLD